MNINNNDNNNISSSSSSMMMGGGGFPLRGVIPPIFLITINY